MVVQNEDGALSVKTMRGSSCHIVPLTGAFKSDFTRRRVKSSPPALLHPWTGPPG